MLPKTLITLNFLFSIPPGEETEHINLCNSTSQEFLVKSVDQVKINYSNKSNDSFICIPQSTHHYCLIFCTKLCSFVYFIVLTSANTSIKYLVTYFIVGISDCIIFHKFMKEKEKFSIQATYIAHSVIIQIY